jgi:uncharacterized protein (TIGR00725 family)
VDRIELPSPAQTAIAVVGAGDAPPHTCELAFAVGREIARHNGILICGGRGGVMEAAARGARSENGHTIGILPGYDRSAANKYIEFAIATGMGQARNAIVVASADAVVALKGEGGTLSEIGLAIKLGRPVVALDAWREISGISHADTPAKAVLIALERAGRAAPNK